MLESVYYENSRGEQVDLFSQTIRANFKEARPFQYNIGNGGFLNRGKEFTIKLLAIGRQYIDELVTLLHYDVVNNKDGKLYINGWYLNCRYTGIRVINHESDRFVKVDVTFYAESFLWTRPKRYELKAAAEFEPQDELNSGDNYLDMDYDLAFDYTNDGASLKRIDNTEIENADMIIQLEGVGTGFSLRITNDNFDNEYIVNTALSGNLLKIDTESKKVSLAGVNVITNVPDASDIFKKLPKGEFLLLWEPADYDLTIDVLEHRSVPLWQI